MWFERIRPSSSGHLRMNKKTSTLMRRHREDGEPSKNLSFGQLISLEHEKLSPKMLRTREIMGVSWCPHTRCFSDLKSVADMLWHHRCKSSPTAMTTDGFGALCVSPLHVTKMQYKTSRLFEEYRLKKGFRSRAFCLELEASSTETSRA